MKNQMASNANFTSFQKHILSVLKIGALAMALLVVSFSAGHGSNLQNVPQVQEALEVAVEEKFDAHAYAAAKGMNIDRAFEQDLKVALQQKFQMKAPVQAKVINLSSFNVIYAYFGLIGLVAFFGVKKAFFS